MSGHLWASGARRFEHGHELHVLGHREEVEGPERRQVPTGAEGHRQVTGEGAGSHET